MIVSYGRQERYPRAVHTRLAHDLDADLRKEMTHETPVERSSPTHPGRS